jgi:hypothetical protein
MKNLEIFCVTNKKLDYLEKLDLVLAGVGKENFSEKYINCKKGINIEYKEKHYSELTFHYWFWKNMLPNYSQNIWIGFCQKRRFWLSKKKVINNFEQLNKNILKKIPKKWEKYESILCDEIDVSNPKKMKLIKRGWKNLIKDPLIFLDKKKHTIKLHFDMHHGYGILDEAIQLLKKKDRSEFANFVNHTSSFNPHIMFITKKEIMNKWFEDLFIWLFKCEKKFGLSNLKGYDQERIYAYLAERYLPFWFKKYTKNLSCPWTLFEKKYH